MFHVFVAFLGGWISDFLRSKWGKTGCNPIEGVTVVTSGIKCKTPPFPAQLLWCHSCDRRGYLVFSETCHWVVCAGTGVIGAGVDGLPRVVNLLVIPQMILASKGSVANITEKSLCLAVDQDVPLQLELRRELLITIWKKFGWNHVQNNS